MNIHEYQAKAILSTFGVPVPRGACAATPQEAEGVARGLGGISFVVKAQIHAGGRGKGRFRGLPPGAKGGVRVVRTPAEVAASAAEMLGNTLVTLQTGPEGRQVARVHVEEGVLADREFYVCLVVDRATGRVCFIASTEGGMDIEEVAQATPERIATVSVDPATGFQPLHGRKLAQALGLSGDLASQAAALARGLYEAFVGKDMSLLEINPLVVTRDGRLLCLDAKAGFDANALFRHPDVARMRDDTEEDARETEAAWHDLSYIALDGTIGCMVNGAGLAMATMDIIQRYGEEPANFLDVGGGATKEKVEAAFRIITADPRVEAILVNIFGGIMKCDVIAAGIVAAVRRSGLAVPLVVRLAGTNVEEGKRILRASGLNVIPADDLDDAAQKIVAAVKKEAA